MTMMILIKMEMVYDDTGMVCVYFYDFDGHDDDHNDDDHHHHDGNVDEDDV